MIFREIHCCIYAILLSGLFFACGEKNDGESGGTAGLDETRIRATSKLPDKATKPDGGTVEKRISVLSPEENKARVLANISQPIVFGKSVANIDMSMTQEVAGKILSSPIGNDDTMYLYSENIRIVWEALEEGAPVKAQFIFIDDGYLGAVNFPEKYGVVKLGTPMAKYFTEADPSGEAFLKDLARFYDGKSADYDCVRLRKCGVQVTATHIRFVLQNGDLFFLNDAQKTLNIVGFVPPPPAETAPLTGDIVFGVGAAGITLLNTESQVLVKLGEPVSVDPLGIYLFDNGHVAVFFNPFSKKLTSMTLSFGFEGKLKMPADIGDKYLGDGFADRFPVSDPLGEAFMLRLGKYFDNKENDVGYNCQIINSCYAQQNDELVLFTFDNGSIVFSKTGYTIEQVTLNHRPTLARTSPLSFAANFPTGIDTLTMASTRAEYVAKLGADRGSFTSNAAEYVVYDNGNIYINYDAADPQTPKILQLNQYYQGALNFPPAMGTVKMNDDFSAKFPPEDLTGTNFLRDLVRHFTGNAGLDCLAATATCAIDFDLEFIYFFVENEGRMFFDIEDKRLLYLIYDEAQVLPAP